MQLYSRMERSIRLSIKTGHRAAPAWDLLSVALSEPLFRCELHTKPPQLLHPSVICQAYFAFQIWYLSKNVLFSVTLWLLSLLRLCGWVVIGALGSLDVEAVSESLPLVWKRMFSGLLITSAAIDSMIAIYLCRFFHTSRRGTFKRTGHLVDRLMLWTIRKYFDASLLAFG